MIASLRPTALPLLPALVACLAMTAATACGGDKDTPAKAEPTRSATSEQQEPEAPAPKLDFGAEGETEADLNAPDDEDWGDETGGEDKPEAEAKDPTAESEQAPKALPFVGPCKIRWSTGSVLRFKYTDDGGTVRVDEDGDGKSDTCGAFTIVDGKTTKVEIDEGCDRKTDVTIEPKYDGKANVATARFTQQVDGKARKRDITLVTMAGFTGLTPGYAIYAKRKQAKVRVRDGLVRTIEVKSPWEGPPLKATFGYDSKGRIKRIKEDFDSDKTTDRRFDYRYDALGNITRMSVTLGFGESETKGRARLSYACFAPKDPAKAAPKAKAAAPEASAADKKK